MVAQEMTSPEAGKTLRFWLGQALQEIRQTRIRLSPEQIALATMHSARMVRRVEGGHGKGVSEHVDALMAIYAELAGMDDPREILELALELWRKDGERPDLPPGYAEKIRPFLLHSMEADIAKTADRSQRGGRGGQRTAGTSPIEPDTPDSTRGRSQGLPPAS